MNRNKRLTTYFSAIFIPLLLAILITSCGNDDDAGNPGGTERFAQETDGRVVMEAENTAFSHTLWELRNAGNPGKTGLFHSTEADLAFNGVLEGFVGSGYLEYTGEDSFREPKDTSMFYSFRIENPGTYYLFFRAFENHTYDPDTEDREAFAGDRNNDAFVRMEGNFQANTAFSANGRYDGAAQSELENFNKLFCGSGDAAPGWGRSIALEPNDFKDPVYVFGAGETYRLYIVGRSKQLAIDRIYLIRLADENGNTDGENIYPFNQSRRDVEDGLYDESTFN
ncbi:MAG: hypothetical protein AAGA66_18065 [Bacteroidota bacterium]